MTLDADVGQDQLPPIAVVLVSLQGPFPSRSIGTGSSILCSLLLFMSLSLSKLLPQIPQLFLGFRNLHAQLLCALSCSVHGMTSRLGSTSSRSASYESDILAVRATGPLLACE